MEPTAELLAQLPKRIATKWKERKERIASEARQLTSHLAEQTALNRRAVIAKLNGELSEDDFIEVKNAISEEKLRLESSKKALDSERGTMDETLKQAERQAVDLVGTWEKGNVYQRQELAKAFFPDGLVFSYPLGFFEPANTMITIWL
jgi:hypothetical protein